MPFPEEMARNGWKCFVLPRSNVVRSVRPRGVVFCNIMMMSYQSGAKGRRTRRAAAKRNTFEFPAQ